jgi:hypothetical protein
MLVKHLVEISDLERRRCHIASATIAGNAMETPPMSTMWKHFEALVLTAMILAYGLLGWCSL